MSEVHSNGEVHSNVEHSNGEVHSNVEALTNRRCVEVRTWLTYHGACSIAARSNLMDSEGMPARPWLMARLSSSS